MTPHDSTHTSETRHDEPQCIAFEGDRRIATGPRLTVALAVKAAHDRAGDPLRAQPILVFDQKTSQPVEFDLRGTTEDVARRLLEATDAAGQPSAKASPPPRRGRGRPKLGVVGREVTLLPRHWQWLGNQPGGASVTLRKLVDQARKTNPGRDDRRRAQESAYRFLSAMAGNQPGFEEAIRALFASDAPRFTEQTEPWPVDIRDHARHLARAVFGDAS